MKTLNTTRKIILCSAYWVRGERSGYYTPWVRSVNILKCPDFQHGHLKIAVISDRRELQKPKSMRALIQFAKRKKRAPSMTATINGRTSQTYLHMAYVVDLVVPPADASVPLPKVKRYIQI